MIYRNRIFCVCIVALCGASLLTAFPRLAQGRDLLSRYRNQNRLLIVFAPVKSTLPYRHQAKQWQEQEAEMKERDIVRFDVFERGTSGAGNTVLSRFDTMTLRKRFGIRRNAFRVLLIGKDGHTAFSSRHPVTAAHIFALIDAMPMRRQEIKQRGARSFD